MLTPCIGHSRQLHLSLLRAQSSDRHRGPTGQRFSSVVTHRRPESALSTGSKQVLGLASAACLLLAPAQALAEDSIMLSFNKNCIGCHMGGGNVVQAGATLKQADLQKNGVASVEAIYDLVYNGKGKMPGYGAGCTPKGKCTFGPRLSDDEIQRLSQFVVLQAEQGWR